MSTDKEPIVGATASLDGRTAMTDAAGSFLLTGVTAGTNRPLMVDGRTASSPNKTYPVIIEPANIVAGQANVNPYTFYLPPIDTQYEVEVIPGQNTVASNPRVPGLSMTIPAGANLRNRDGSPVARVSITPLAIDRTPAPLPPNIKTGLVYTSQPGGAISDIPMPVTYPNLLGVDPGTQVQLYAFNHDTVQWYVYGTGRVSDDGRTISPEINPATGKPYGLPDFSWHFPNASQSGNPGGDGGDCDTCPEFCSLGDEPVDYSTGIKFEFVTDLSFQGVRGGLSLSRFYSSDNSASAILGRFGRGWKDNYDVQLTGSWTAGGAGRVIVPDEQTGRLFNYTRTEAGGTLVFTTSATVKQLGDVVRKLTDGSFEYRYKDGDLIRFNSSGRMTAAVDRNGNTTTLIYTGSRLTQIVDPVGRTLTLTYDSSNRIISALDSLGREWRYTYDSSVAFGILSTVTDPMGNVTRYGYTNLRLSSITDPRGNFVKRITYDTQGRVTSQQFADGGIERYDYVLSGNIVTSTTITDPLGRKTSKRFNANGYVVQTVDQFGQSATVTRDLSTNLATAKTGPCGCPEETLEFDKRGNLTRQTDRLGGTVTVEYEPVYNRPTTTIDELGRNITATYDSHGNLATLSNSPNQTTTFIHDSFGQLTSITDGLGHVVRMEYDSNGNMTAFIDALNNRSTMEYDSIGRMTAIEDALGHRTTLEYDSRDRILALTDSTGDRTVFTFDGNNNQTSVKDALNRIWRKSYDSKNRLISVTDPLGRVTRAQYNANDEITAIISPLGRTTRQTFDSRGNVTSITDPLGGIVRFNYDSSGDLTTLTDQRGNTTSYVYDELHRLISTRSPLGQNSSVIFDAAGNMVQETDFHGRQISHLYDDQNRLVRSTYADAVVTYDYDSAGRLTRVNDSQSGFIDWTYDNADRVLSETTPLGQVQYTYNQAGQRLSMTAPDKPQVTYSYDSGGRLQTISQGAEVFAYTYDAVSRIASLQRPNGVNSTYSYDPVGNLARLTHSRAINQVIEDYSYGYNADNELTSITSLLTNQQLTTSRNAGNANVLNQITQFGNATYSFDTHGQTTSKTDSQGTTNYGWDARGRLKQVVQPGGQTITYGYDALGRQVSRSTAIGSENYIYDGMDVILDKKSDGSSLEYLNGGGIDQKLRQKDSGAALYFLSDHLGSTIALTDSAGSVVDVQQYEAFGQSAGSALTRFGYTGRERDALTGLLQYRARWYDPQQARFLSEDPLGFLAGPNLYSYVRNNPIGSVDPFGLQDSAGSTNTSFWGLTASYWRGVGNGVVGGVTGTVRLVGGLVTHPVDTVSAVGSDLSMRAQTMYEVVRHPIQAKEAITDAIIELGPNRSMEILGDAGGNVIAYKAMSNAGTYLRNGFRYGREFKIGNRGRIAPWGNRGKGGNPPHKIGRWPHYHRRVPNPKKPGDSMPGQGMGRHRPWEKKSTDKCFWDRF
ncbi:MAG TPA: RHS repeat-associated core domain-containing protein [Pyrinomonadaceae bacterium]|nr:RHS repeat-associated core domain-containing protein [Pyrinomonadaceae bacterium]